MAGFIIAAALGGVVFGVVHAVSVIRHDITLRPAIIVVLVIALSVAIWAFTTMLTADQERIWWAFVVGFAFGNGVVSLSPQARRRSVRH